MPKSKKQLEHTHTFIDENLSGHTHIYFHHRKGIISGLWWKNGATTRTMSGLHIKYTNRIVTDHSKKQAKASQRASFF